MRHEDRSLFNRLKKMRLSYFSWSILESTEGQQIVRNKRTKHNINKGHIENVTYHRT